MPQHRKWFSPMWLGCVIVLAASASPAVAQSAGNPPALPAIDPLTLGKVFTFLFLTLGPFNVVGPFVEMTRGRDASFKRRLAAQGTLIAALALLVAATVGAKTLRDWGVSAAALFITAGILLFLVGMRLVLSQYKARRPVAEVLPEAQPVDDASALSASAMAFAPLAFPTIVTPYGIAVLMLALTLPLDQSLSNAHIVAIAGLVLAADLAAMLVADHAPRAPLVMAAAGIVASVMAVLQVALSIQAVIAGLRLLGVVAIGTT